MRTRRTLASVICTVSILGTLAGNVCAANLRNPNEKGRVGTAPLCSLRDPEEGTIIVDGKAFSVYQNCKGENWKFVASEHTLYLDGYNGMYIDLGPLEEAKIVLTGANFATSGLNAPALLVDGDLTIEGEGHLTLEVSACHNALYARGGALTISNTSLTIKGSGEFQDVSYLVMADQALTITHSEISIKDEINGQGGSIGSLTGDVQIDEGTKLAIFSTAKALSAPKGKILISGAGTSVELNTGDSALYAKKGITVEDRAEVLAQSSGENQTAVYAPEGDIRVDNAEMRIESPRTAIAGQKLVLSDAYICEPSEALTQVVSSLVTVVVDDTVAPVLHILPGVAPTPTPAPTNTPTPTPAPVITEAPEEIDDRIVTPRMVLGACLIVAGLAAIVILLVSKIRGFNVE